MYQFEIFNAGKEGKPSTVKKYKVDMNDLFTAIGTWAEQNKATEKETNYILNFLVFGKGIRRTELNVNGEIMQVTCTQRSDARLAVTLTEVYDTDVLFQNTRICKTPEDAVRFVRESLETEENERNLRFEVDWKALEDDIAFGNQYDRPFRIEKKESMTAFFLTSHLFEI